ncbi:sigma-70 region 4 domain-containing protein [Microvirga mediterraneensis]|uniref:Sigma-70 region 4 domain-containing protein n=1 Tax=Microvirga mediterraneensis TaxID=2754695 RepID=A0A838BWD3_9HYPH|nr:sigma-70 region 4 domain-containing protein [Microvirga mediterraneensis]MBA1159389.1 sigma-70 region 4 domain-containing protein [Microvirga mediterraneensis]
MTESTVWMSYAEAAEALGISAASVKQKARRGRWPRQVGNDGKARVAVPSDLLEVKQATTPATNPPTSPDTTLPTSTVSTPPVNPVHEALARLEGEVVGLRLALDAERRRADAAEARVVELREDRDRWHGLAVRPWWRRLVG